MENYYLALSPNVNETHPVHKEGCPFLPEKKRRIFLGKFISGNDAGAEGKKYHSKSFNCPFCSKEAYHGELDLGSMLSAELRSFRIDAVRQVPMLEFLN